MKTPAAEGHEEAITAAEMRRLEEEAFASGRLSPDGAMDDAAGGVFQAILDWPEFSHGTHHALILCGPGNNGGDGYVVARRLRRFRWLCTVLALGDIEAMPQPAARARRIWEGMGEVHDIMGPMPSLFGPEVVVDALFGIGLTREIAPALAVKMGEIEGLATRAGAVRFAVDIPSGLDADTGRVLGMVMPAHETVTFHRRKPAHNLRPDLCGTVRVVDIGL